MKELRKILCCLLILGLVFTNESVYVAAIDIESFIDKRDYKEIYTFDDLASICNDLDGNYVLMADIDLSSATVRGGVLDTGHGWTPIEGFQGIFDGNGHYINGMHIYYDDIEQHTGIGLFADAGYGGAYIKNLGMKNVDINITNYTNGSNIYCGTIIGDGSEVLGGGGARIENCFADGSINIKTISLSKGYYNFFKCGGLAGSCISAENCYNMVNITTEIIDENSNECLSSYYESNEDDIYYNMFGIAGISAECSEYANHCFNSGIIDEGKGQGIYNVYYPENNDLSNYVLIGTALYENAMPLTLAQMEKIQYFAGFDFNKVWEMDEYRGEHPQLRSCMEYRLKEISIISLPNKLIYSQNEKIDLTGGLIKLTYEDGVEIKAELSNDMIFDNISEITSDIGTKTITIKKGDLYTTFNIEVEGISVESITLDNADLVLEVGRSLVITAKVEPDNASDKELTWSSTDSNIVEVTENGKILAKSEGTASIVVTSKNSITAECKVTVKDKDNILKPSPTDIPDGSKDNTITPFPTNTPLPEENDYYEEYDSGDKKLENKKVVKLKVPVVKIKKSGSYIGAGVKYSIKWNKIKGADGYQIYVYEKENQADSWYKMKKNTIKLKYDIEFSSMYVIKAKVRAYKIVYGKKVYSKWSKVVKKKFKQS